MAIGVIAIIGAQVYDVEDDVTIVTNATSYSQGLATVHYDDESSCWATMRPDYSMPKPFDWL